MFEEHRDMAAAEYEVFVLLAWLRDHRGDVEANSLEGFLADDPTRSLEATSALATRALQEAWLRRQAGNERLNGIPPVTLTHDGVRYVDAIRNHQRNSGQLRNAARGAVLRFIDNRGGSHVDVANFLESPPSTFFGISYAHEDIVAACKYLADRGLIVGETRADGLFHDASITANGADCVEQFRGEVNDYLAASGASPGPTYVQHNHGGAQSQFVQGQEVSVRISGENSHDAVRELLRDILATLERLSVEHPETPQLDTLRSIGDSVQVAVEQDDQDSETGRGLANVWATAARTSALSAAAAAGTQAPALLVHLADQVAHLAQML